MRASEAEVSSGFAAAAGGVPARRQAVRAVAFALILIAGLWSYRHEALAMGTRLRALQPYRELVSSLRNDPDFLLREHYAQPQQRIPRRDGHAADDLPPLVVFTDFECSVYYCEEQRLRRQAEGSV